MTSRSRFGPWLGRVASSVARAGRANLVHVVTVVAVIGLVLAMDGTWSTRPVLANPVTQPAGSAGGSASAPSARSGKKELTGKLNLNTATEEQLMLLPSVGPAKAERIVTWRKKNGGFKRTADLRRVKGFGYRTFKRLAPYLDIKGDTTLAVKH